MIQFPFNEVDGLLSQEDRVSLRDLAMRCVHVKGDFFEVGSYKGLSALCILEGISQRKKRPYKIVCFDWFEPEKLNEFRDNLIMAGKRPDVVEIAGDFKETIKNVPPLAFGFIDHTHNLEDTRAAYEMFWPHISKGGILCFHDYNNDLYPEATEYLNTLPHKRVLETSILAFEKE